MCILEIKNELRLYVFKYLILLVLRNTKIVAEVLNTAKICRWNLLKYESSIMRTACHDISRELAYSFWYLGIFVEPVATNIVGSYLIHEIELMFFQIYAPLGVQVCRYHLSRRILIRVRQCLD